MRARAAARGKTRLRLHGQMPAHTPWLPGSASHRNLDGWPTNRVITAGLAAIGQGCHAAAFMDKQTPLDDSAASQKLEFESPDGRRSRRTATTQRTGQGAGQAAGKATGQRVSHAVADFGGSLGQPFPSARAADAVSIPEGGARRRLYRARLRTDRLRHRLRRHATAARLHRRPFGCTRDSAARPHRRRARAHPARLASELLVADCERRAARRRQQRLSSGRLCDFVGAHGRSADGTRLFHPYLRRLPRWRGGARDHGRPCDLGRRVRRADRGGRDRRAGRAVAPRRGDSRCRRQARAGGGWHRCTEDKHPDARVDRADRVLHPARPVQFGYRQLRRSRADEWLRHLVLHSQPRADLVSRRQRRRRSCRRLPRRPHRTPRPGRGRLLCDQHGDRARDRVCDVAGNSADRRDDDGRIPRRGDRAVTRHAGAQRRACGRSGTRLRHCLHRLQFLGDREPAAVRLDHGSEHAARRVHRLGRVHGVDSRADIFHGAENRRRSPRPQTNARRMHC